MTTQFPTALDSFANPSGTDRLSSDAVPHAAQHANANDAIEALEAKVGVNNSTDPTSLDYRVKTLESGGTNVSLNNLTDVTISDPASGHFLRYNIATSQWENSAVSYAAASHNHDVSDVTGLQTALDGKAAATHSHIITDVTGLEDALLGKSNTGHTHSIANVSGLQAALEDKAAATHNHDLAYDANGAAASIMAGHVLAADPHPQYLTPAEANAAYAATTHSHSIDAVSGLQTALDGKAATTHTHTGVYEPADSSILKSAHIGTVVQAYDADLTSWAAITPSSKQDTLVSGTSIKTVNGNSLLGSGDLVIAGGGGSGTVTSVAVSGGTTGLTTSGSPITSSGTITLGGTLAVANGGTGATTASAARTALGLAVGSDVQAYSANLAAWSGLATSAKQDALVSGTSIKTVNSASLLGSGDIAVQATLVSGTNIKTVNSNSLLGSGNIAVQDTLVSGTNIKTVNGNSLLGSGDLVISGGGSAVAVSDEGTSLTTGVTSFNFTGAGVTASAVGNAVTVNVPGGGGAGALTIDSKTAAYTVVAGDLGKVINCTSGTFTVSLTAAATLGAGFYCWIWNSSAATAGIIIDPNASETIDGNLTLTLRSMERCRILCTGTAWLAEKTVHSIVMQARGDTTANYGIAQASGLNSLSIGAGTQASGGSSTAIGSNSGNSGSQAVTGGGAVAVGGSYASGNDSFAAAISINTSSYGAQGAGSAAIGSLSKATGSSAHAVGSEAIASGSVSYAAIGGQANGTRSVAFGYCNVNSTTGKYAFASSYTPAVGGGTAGIHGRLVLGRDTTDATATVLTSDNGAVGAANQLNVPINSAYAFIGTIVARQKTANGTASAAWKVEGLIRKEGTNATTTLVASSITAISNVPAWSIALSADTTNGALAITVTGAAATNIRWVANINSTEVTYA